MVVVVVVGECGWVCGCVSAMGVSSHRFVRQSQFEIEVSCGPQNRRASSMDDFLYILNFRFCGAFYHYSVLINLAT